jgi:hypothetical protein
MIAQYDEYERLGRQGIEAALRNFSTISRGLGAVTSEAALFFKRQFAGSSADFDKLASVRTLDKAVAVQSDFLIASFEGMVDHSTRVNQLVADLARQAVNGAVASTPGGKPASARTSK